MNANVLDLTRYRSQQLGGFFDSLGPNIYSGQNDTQRTIFGSVPVLFPPTQQGPAANKTVGNPSVIVGTTTPANQTPSNTLHYFDSIANLVSQAVQGFAKNKTNQVSTSQGVITNPDVMIAGSNAEAIAAQSRYTDETRTSAADAPDTLGGLLNTGLNWAMANPIPLAIGGIALYLLFRKPPGSNRRY